MTSKLVKSFMWEVVHEFACCQCEVFDGGSQGALSRAKPFGWEFCSHVGFHLARMINFHVVQIF